MLFGMGASNNLPAAVRALSDDERRFILHYIECGNAEAAKAVSGYHTTVQGSEILRRPHMAAALRAEVTRQLATDGARIGYHTLRRIAQDQKAPAAAQVAAAKTLLQGAGLLESPDKPKDAKSINDMTRDELREYIESKRQEIEGMEKRLADGALNVTPQPIDPLA